MPLPITVQDILYHIAEELHQYSGADKEAAIEEFLFGNNLDLHVTITANVEESELDYLNRYGHGNTFYFRIKDFEHGNQLASQLFTVMTGEETRMNLHPVPNCEAVEQYYLFVHLNAS